MLPAASGDVLLNRVDIFGESWIGAFGYPFQTSAFGSNDLSLNGSFGCLNPTAVVTGSGTITAIGADYIECDDDKGVRQRFGLGSCSRLESTRKVPAVDRSSIGQASPAETPTNCTQAAASENDELLFMSKINFLVIS